MVQINRDTGKERQIRQPLKWKAPSKPLVPPGPTTVVNVPRGSPGTTIQVPARKKAANSGIPPKGRRCPLESSTQRFLRKMELVP